jgi:hypothetical protein
VPLTEFALLGLRVIYRSTVALNDGDRPTMTAASCP